MQKIYFGNQNIFFIKFIEQNNKTKKHQCINSINFFFFPAKSLLCSLAWHARHVFVRLSVSLVWHEMKTPTPAQTKSACCSLSSESEARSASQKLSLHYTCFVARGGKQLLLFYKNIVVLRSFTVTFFDLNQVYALPCGG